MTVVNRSGVRRNEVPQLEAAIKGGSPPVQVARQFRMSLEATINYYKLYKVDVSDFDDVVGGSAIPTAQMAGELVELRQKAAKRAKATNEIMEKKDARLVESQAECEVLKAELAEMKKKFMSPVEKRIAKEENNRISLVNRETQKETGGK